MKESYTGIRAGKRTIWVVRGGPHLAKVVRFDGETGKEEEIVWEGIPSLAKAEALRQAQNSTAESLLPILQDVEEIKKSVANIWELLNGPGGLMLRFR